MKPTEKRDLAIISLARAYENKDTALISRVEAILLPDAVKLPPELETALNEWGNNPVVESDMYALIKSAPLEDVKEVAIRKLNLDDFSALDISTFTARVIDRITSKTDADGIYKTTPTLDGMKLPRTSAIRSIKQMILDGKEQDEIEAKAFETVGFADRSVLTDWEQELVLNLLKDFITAADSDALGAMADRTPFARYLKN